MSCLSGHTHIRTFRQIRSQIHARTWTCLPTPLKIQCCEAGKQAGLIGTAAQARMRVQRDNQPEKNSQTASTNSSSPSSSSSSLSTTTVVTTSASLPPVNVSFRFASSNKQVVFFAVSFAQSVWMCAWHAQVCIAQCHRCHSAGVSPVGPFGV